MGGPLCTASWNVYVYSVFIGCLIQRSFNTANNSFSFTSIIKIHSDKVIVIVFATRETACEVLFEQDADEVSLATLLLDSLVKVFSATS